MTFPKARLAVSACLFLIWLGFLLYLVVDSRRIVLSKPQFMVAQLFVVVDVRDKDGKADPEVTIEEALWTSDRADKQHSKLRLADLAACAKVHGYRGAGKYLLPLVKSDAVSYRIAPVPRLDSRQPFTHGTVEVFGLFSHRVFRWLPIAEAEQTRKEFADAGWVASLTPEEIRIYSWTPDTRAQVERIIAATRR